MEWIDTLNMAINYIEDNLENPISNEDVAKHVYVSSFYLQKVFGIATGITIGEYIRNRRLSMAAHDLVLGKQNVLETAVKYGYDSPESFSKAFKRFHGVNPAQVNKGNIELKSFARLVIKINLEGAKIMDYKIVEKEAFSVVLFVEEFNEVTSRKEIPLFWDRFFAKGYDKCVCPEFGCCLPVDKTKSTYGYGIGGLKEHVVKMVPGLVEHVIPAHTWAIFKCVGPMPKAIQQTWNKIYTEWLPNAPYDICNDFDFEYYPGPNTQDADYYTEIWLPVVKKG